MSRRFNRFMVDVNIGTHRKIRRLAPAERWCFVAGVLALAAESPIRGALLVTEQVPLELEDFATHAGVPLTVAKSTLAKLRDLGVLSHDEQYGCDVVRDWTDWQAEPKLADPTSARRKALSRDPALRGIVRHRDGDKCRYCEVEVNWTDRRSASGGTYDHVDPHGENIVANLVVCCRGCNSRKGARSPHEADMELLPAPNSISIRDLDRHLDQDKRSRSGREVEKNNPPVPPASGGRQRDRDRFDQELAAWVAEELPQLPPKETAGMVRSALGHGLRQREEILAYLARWNSSASIEAVA